ncbi:hypothetical protein ACWEFL_17570 [Streptomyces sp. NPDC004838]
MRGLRDRRGRVTMAAGTTAIAGLAVVGLFTAACSAGGTGVQDEGSAAAQDSAKGGGAPSPASPSDGSTAFGREIDPVQLIKNDPQVSKDIKDQLKPCGGAEYPVDTSYGNMTGGTSPDIVINVLSCGDAVGLGTYVYRMTGQTYETVFVSEEPAVVSEIDRGDLVVTKQVWDKGGSVDEPSGEEVTTYHWSNGKFVRLHWVRNEYRGSVADGGGGFLQPEPLVPAPTTKD